MTPAFARIAGRRSALHLALSALIAAHGGRADRARSGIRALLRGDGRRDAAALADRRRRRARAAHHAHHLRPRKAAPEVRPRRDRRAAGRGARLRQLRDVRGASGLQRVRRRTASRPCRRTTSTRHRAPRAGPNSATLPLDRAARGRRRKPPADRGRNAQDRHATAMAGGPDLAHLPHLYTSYDAESRPTLRGPRARWRLSRSGARRSADGRQRLRRRPRQRQRAAWAICR